MLETKRRNVTDKDRGDFGSETADYRHRVELVVDLLSLVVCLVSVALLLAMALGHLHQIWSSP